MGVFVSMGGFVPGASVPTAAALLVAALRRLPGSAPRESSLPSPTKGCSCGRIQAPEQNRVVTPPYRKIDHEPKECVTRTPSTFRKERYLTRAQRLANTQEMRPPRILPPLDLRESSCHKSLFQPFPSEVVFQHYVAHEVFKVPLVLRNNDKVPRLVKVTLENSPYFKLVRPKCVPSKVAPGLALTYHVIFTPEENKDYSHQITCVTDREQFIVPIRAIGARAILDFPEQLDFAICPVKYSTQKTLLVRNIGNQEAHYSISTQSPFSVDCSVGTLGIGDTVQVTVDFHPLKTGDHSGSLLVHYDTGENTNTNLYGVAVNANIKLEKKSVTFENTYLGQLTRRSMVIQNRSDIIAHFQWKAFGTQEEEDQRARSFVVFELSRVTMAVWFLPRGLDVLHTEPSTSPLPELSAAGSSWPGGGSVKGDSSAPARKLCSLPSSGLSALNSGMISATATKGSVGSRGDMVVPYTCGSEREEKTVMLGTCSPDRAAAALPGEALPRCSSSSSASPEHPGGRRSQLRMEVDSPSVVGSVFEPGRSPEGCSLVTQHHLSCLISCTFPNQSTRVQGESLLSSDGIFSIEPAEGEIWPNSSAEFIVTFKPQEARVYQQAFYCDISGRETRLPLCIKGEGIGPQLRFNLEQLDIGKVFIGAVHNYEVFLFNKGLISAVFSLVPPATALGSCFTFLPSEGEIFPHNSQAIQISFSSTTLGKFTELFKFNVSGSPEPVTLTVSGCVIGPTFDFDVPSLCFGDVSFGFPHTLSCRLTNTSLVPMTFHLRIPGDGLGRPSVTSVARLSSDDPQTWRQGVEGCIRPTEFTIEPCSGTIPSQGFTDIQVTLCSNTVRRYKLALVVDVDGVGMEVRALLLTARCKVPELEVLHPTMTFGQCFLNFPYQQALTLVNRSHLPGCYRLLPQKHEQGDGVLYSSPAPSGIIQPHSSINIPLILEAQKLGHQSASAFLVVFGNEKSPLHIILEAVGEGPVVYVHPREINFGNIQVLEDASRTLYLSNQSVIPASFRAEVAGKRSRCRIEPSKGVIPPETEVAVTVTANLDDIKKFEDKVIVSIKNSHSYDVLIQAFGIGTTIVTDKPLAPELNWGPHFSLDPCCYRFNLTNKGRRIHRLYWRTEGFPPFPCHDRLPAIQSRGKGSSQNPKPASPVFKIHPLTTELMPGQSVEVTLEGSSSTPQVVKERLLCHAIVGNKVKKTQIMQVDVMCEFIAPVLQVSSREITFRVEKQPSDVLSVQYKPLSLKNTTSLPLSIVLMVEQPFQVCSASQQPLPDQPVKLGIGKELNLSIGFNPAYKEGRNSWEAEKTLKICFLEHPREEKVTIRGEVFFPNLHIQTTTCDFGCVLNDTEHTRYIQMTNCSPLPVQYNWLFLVDDSTSHLRVTPPTPKYFTKDKPPKEEGAQPECPSPAESILGHGSVKEQVKALAAVGDSVPQPPDADDTQETEVFSILPLFGVLQPGESEQVTVTFFGHPNIMAHVTALCRVEGGPTYEVALRGEASLIHYLLDSTEMDCGLQLFTNVTKSEVTLRNSGKVGFTYVVLSPSTATADSPQPGLPLVQPSTGYIAPGREQVLTVYYLPGVPGVFCRTFKIQVGHLEPEEVTLKAEGSFPRISLDLPRRIKGNKNYEQILKEAKEKLGGDSQRDKAGEATATEPPMDDSGTMLDIGLQMEMENMLLEQHALEQQKALLSFDHRARRRLLKVELPEYVLDFGHVILGDIRTHVVKITNPGQLPASFCASGRALRGTGNPVDLDRVKNLRFCDTETFEVCFDPQSANLPVGEVNVVLPIKAEEGPTFPIRLRANVAAGSLRVSRDRLEFAAVHCGQCQEETIQLHNQLQVPCKWFITVNEPVVKVDKYLPLYIKQKLLQERKNKPCVFEVLPSAGTLTPGQQFNVRVRFTPTEEKSYRSKLKINICQSTQHLQLQVSGSGLEPRLEFSPPVLELGPLLPFSPGVGGKVVVKNPCEFPIEFYSLEFDQQYLLEEQVLRVLKDYDCHNTLLLPPRAPGEELPPELLEYYKDQKRLQDEQAKSETEEQANQDNERQHDTPASKDPPGELDDSPVSRAIARHLGIDTSPEGRAAQNRRGIVVIIHGTPLTGKTSAAVALSKYYGAACLSIDAVVREAISERSSWAALRARELCLRAATEQREMEEAGPRADVSLIQQFSTDPKHMSQSSSGTKVRRSPVSSQSWQNRRTERNTSQGQKPCERDSSGWQGLSSSLSVSSTPCAPPQQWLSPSIVGEVGFMSCVLPEDVLVAILSERLQLSDCFQGVVFDGLETPFACNTVSALLCLLKAIQNRPHIYFVDLYQSADALKARKAAPKEQEERDLEEAAKKEKERHREMDEEEYEALTEEEKAQFDNYIRQVKREKKRKMEQLARELEEKHRQELECLREEELKKKKHRRREVGGDSVSGKKGQPGVRQNTNTSTSKVSDGREGSVMKGSTKEQPDCVASDKGEKKMQRKTSLRDEGQAVVVQPLDTEQGKSKSETLSDSEKNLALRFQIYKALRKHVAHTLAFWDRVQGALHQEEAEHSIDQRHHLSSCKIGKEREKEQLETLKALENARLCQPEEESAEGSARSQGVGVPCLDIQVLSPEDVTQKILESGKLPAAEQILDELGLGPSGPPIPPTVFYSVIHYPAKRAVPAAEDDLKHFTFVVPEDATVEEGKTEIPVGVLALPTVKTSEEQLTPTRARSRKEKASGSREKRSPRRSRKRVQGSAMPTPAHSPKVCQSSMDIVPTPDRPARLSSFRWIVPAHGEVELKIFFTSTELGQFDQTLHFEVLGTNRLFQLHCRGTCLYPTISRDPRVVFPHWRDSKADDEIIFKQYVMDTGVFHFGPLLCGKSRDWYKALHCPGNCEKITILNVTPLEAEVHFSFEHDIKGNTFLLEPSSMKLRPTEKQELSIWAYPTSTGLKEDNLICCIQGNPEPVIFHLCCQGVQVELGVSPKQVNFSKMLLHRREHRTLVLQNSTPLPMNWQLSGLDNLDTDFSVSQDKGTVEPRAESEVHLYLKATKTLSMKKTIQLEVSDAENILGIARIENIQICAEAHDNGLTINISKGINGGVVFETLRVMDEAKQVLSLKSKWKDPIGYSFSLETADPSTADLASHFTVQPQKGVLAASEHPVQVQLLFHPKTELNIEDKPILLCKVFEPNVSEGGRTITIIPVRVSAKAVFSKYSIYPASLNFGAVTSGSRKTCTFTLENKGDLDFKFLICRPEQDPVRRKSAQLPESAHPPGNVNVRTSTSSIRQNRLLLQKDTNPLMQTHLTVGMFTVYPGVGSIPPGGQQVITVDCYAKLLGTCKESLSINIKNRDPKDHPSGIPYTLFAESCLPAFVVDDIESIFEEHRICSSINLCHVLQTVKDKGVFIRDENKFIFTNVLVGHRATARFKICNVGKVPCDVVFSIKPIPGELDSYVSNIFEVDPVQMCVPSCSHIFATVTFTPQTMQIYQCAFEASLNTQASPVAAEAQSLTFEISGDGNLPQVTVLRPVLQNRRGNPLLLFKKLLLGDLEKLPLVLRNDGIVPVQLMIDLLDEEGVFSLKAKPDTQCIYQAAGVQDSHGAERKAHTASLVLHHKELAEFDVLFKPNLAQRVEAKIHISLVDNPYREIDIQLVGEGYEDDFTLDNIHGLVADGKEEDTKDDLEEDVIEAVRVNHIQFGECHIGTPYTVTFTITNRSKVEAMRFEWLAEPPFHFSPKVGHLHAGCAKDITVTLKSDVAVAFRKHPVKCTVASITFQLPPEHIPDWDDHLRSIKWVDATEAPGAKWPLKKKVMEMDPEPAHTVMEKSSREVELHLSAVADYAQFKMDTDTIQFKETLLFQTRTFPFQLSNTGNVALEYTWLEAVEDESEVSCTTSTMEQCLPSLDGDFLSSASGTSVKLQSSHSSPLDHTVEQVSSSSSWSLNTAHAPTLPFSIEPKSGTIPAGQEQHFQMKFSPTYMGDFESRMLCRIPNLNPDQKGPEVTVKGRSLMPICHFELEDSDYITAKRHDPELHGPEEPELNLNRKVIEIAAVGLRSRNRRTITAMNLTSSAYSFQWTCQDPAGPPEQVAFFCRTERGRIQPGKKGEITFEFIPRRLGITKSFWLFTIPEQRFSVPFLLVGNATDPLVNLDRAHLNFPSLLIGHEIHQTIYIINSEKKAFSFAFRESSLLSEGGKTSVKIKPLEGSIAPLSRLPITISLTPMLEGEEVYNLKCNVKRKMQPLSLNIKVTGYRMNVSVRCEDSDGSATELSTQEVNVIDFKEVHLNENISRIFTICNNSKFDCTFSWELSGATDHKQFLTIGPRMGTVQAEGEVQTQLAFHPRKMCSLKDVKLILQIGRGPTITCVFRATVVVPTVHFSTKKLNFGTCLTYQAGMPPAQQTFVITNTADKDVRLNCLFTNTAHLKVDFPGSILRPGGTVEVPVTFYPREVTSYHELIPFEINGLCRQTVEVRGRGTEIKVEVVEPRGKVVELGALSISQTVKKTVTIANRSTVPLAFKLRFRPSKPELQEAGVICLKAINEQSMKPKGGIYKVEVTFSPKCRIQPFTEEVMVECNGVVRSLFLLRGSCQGIHVSLNQDHLSFNAVVQQSYTSQRIVMQNTGDIGVKFKWDVESFKPDFSISPTEGSISPGMDVPFVVTFHPSKLSPAFQYEGLQCFIQGSQPLRLTLAGCCVETPVIRETLTFACNVREEHSQTVHLSNPSNEACTVRPILEGKHWKGPEVFHLEANEQKKPYKITYSPLTMSSGNKKHQGSIFFPLPDGTGLYYLLQGSAEAPKCSGHISRQVPCRTSYTELIPVSNWLNRPQRFLVVVDRTKPENRDKSSVLEGLKYIDVPASSKEYYKLTFLFYKEGVFNMTVTFLNEVTKEYLFYTVTFKATASGPISAVEVTTPIRQRLSSTVKVDNPLPVPVTFAIDCKVPHVSVPSHVTVPAQTQADLAFEYLPLKMGETTGELVLQSSELGSCYYNLHLKATESKPEKPLSFCTTLGSSHTITTKIMNYARQKTAYLLQTNSPDFQTKQTITAAAAGPGGSELSVDVTFEPCQLGKTRAVLQLSSPLGGEYCIPLVGLALPPKPQGPFLIEAGSSIAIPFKNIFLQATAFQYAVEHPAFSVRGPKSLGPKKSSALAVSYEGGPAPAASRLVVSCPAAARAAVSWEFYLRGIPAEK
ncbi:hydrocephalus-inducing protein homolog [Porphyrio hochstetteri]